MNRVILVGKFGTEKRKDWDQDVVVSEREVKGAKKIETIPVWMPSDLSRPVPGDIVWVEGTLFVNSNRFLSCRVVRWEMVLRGGRP